MTSISPAAPTGTRPASVSQFAGIEAQQLVGRPMELVEALSDMTESAVTEFLITCATQQNEARKRGDFEAAHAFHHAECEAIRFINNRHGAKT